MTLVLVVVAVAAGFGLAWVATRRETQSATRQVLEEARLEAAAIGRAAGRDAEAEKLAAQADAREQSLEVRTQGETELTELVERQARREERLARRDNDVIEEIAKLNARHDALQASEREIQSKTDRAKNTRRDIEGFDLQYRSALEGAAGTTSGDLKTQIVESWVEECKAEAAQRIRAIEQTASDPEHGRTAQRIMGIASQRYQGHYLTERLLSNIAIPPGFAEYLTADDSRMLHAVEEGCGVKLEIHESGEKIRLEAGDGVVREVARRALSRLMKGTAPSDLDKDPKGWVAGLAIKIDREIEELGRRAFSELKIPRAHADIVKLVGRLNYRTSYTQNQWKHALEASFLGGMMASELGLDVKIARRATLMHDIGKSLTHEIDGSHAVIGADYARRLGESEIVANAIGAHHADEPANSLYAYLVAAADAMSGGRPGARREQNESYSTRLEDLERIGNGFRGVDRAFAVQGGREVRVYVREKEVNDMRAVTMSAEIAKKISDEMTFPGQIKVTVIRQVEAVEIAN